MRPNHNKNVLNKHIFFYIIYSLKHKYIFVELNEQYVLTLKHNDKYFYKFAKYYFLIKLICLDQEKKKRYLKKFQIKIKYL